MAANADGGSSFPSIIYEDADVLVINKPSGLLTQPTGEARQVAKTVLDYFPSCRLVHRLDRETSGVLILAKSEAAHEFLKAQFQARTLVKNYRAIVYGNLPEKSGTVDWPIGRHPKHTFLRLAALPTDLARGKGPKPPLREASTKYEVLESFKNHDYLSLWPKTGRTHQLRVHLKALGHPIVCDHLYAPGREGLPPLGRLALHAASLEISLPAGRGGEPTGGRNKFEAELPPDFQAMLDYLRAL